MHRPDELQRELEHAGLAVEAVIAVEGPLWLLNDLDERWQDDHERGRLLRAVRSVEHETTMLGVSAHLLVIAHSRGELPLHERCRCLSALDGCPHNGCRRAFTTAREPGLPSGSSAN